MTKKSEQIDVVFRGGERDGVTDRVDADTDEITVEVGHNPHDELYVRSAEQDGDHWVFRYTTRNGESAPGATLAGIEVGTTLQANLDALEAEVKKSGNEKKRTAA